MTRLTNGKVYDVAKASFEDLDILLRGDRIEALVPRDQAATADQDVLDMRGAFVLPGLIDCHVHLTLDPSVGDPSAYKQRDNQRIRRDTSAAARATLLGGITSVRDCGGWEYLEMAVREEIAAGTAIGPRMFLSGKLVWVETPGARDYPGMFELAKTPEELCAAAARQLDKGADFIKVMATGMVLSPEGEQPDDVFYTVAELSALTAFAHARGVKVACHAEGLNGIWTVVEAGTDSVEHVTFADDDVLKVMASKGTFAVPTCMVMSAYLDDPKLRQQAPRYIIERFEDVKPRHSRAIHQAHAHGVPIAMGTDAGAPGVYHGKNAQEVGRMVRDAGLPPQAAIRAATLDAARLLGHEDKLGSLEAGKYADLIAARENPLDDPAALEDLCFVMKGGDIVRDELH